MSKEGHSPSIEEVSADALDTYAAAAFCSCGWRSEWQHAERSRTPEGDELAEGEAYNAAQAEGEEHSAEVRAVSA